MKAHFSILSNYQSSVRQWNLGRLHRLLSEGISSAISVACSILLLFLCLPENKSQVSNSLDTDKTPSLTRASRQYPYFSQRPSQILTWTCKCDAFCVIIRSGKSLTVCKAVHYMIKLF